MTEAKLTQAEGGWLEPEADGWYVLNARDAKWLTNEIGGYCSFEGQERFPEFGLDETALKHGAGVEIATNEQSEAYAKFGKLEASTGPDGLLP
jgi:hypothetical protein